MDLIHSVIVCAADIIERGIRDHPELSVGMATEGLEVRSVGNTMSLHNSALVEAFNLKAATEYQLKNCKKKHQRELNLQKKKLNLKKLNFVRRRIARGADGHAAAPGAGTGPRHFAQHGAAQRRSQSHRELQQTPVPLAAAGYLSLGLGPAGPQV